MVDLEFEQSVQRHARKFGLKSLVDLLMRRGYRRDQLLFESNREGNATSLVHAVEFPSGTGGPIVITVNLGLLGDNALLPSYFLREIENSPDPQRFYDFIRFFDHRLIESYLRASWPEDDVSVFGDFAKAQRAISNVVGYESVSSMHWLAQVVFPELRVRVQRGSFVSSTTSHACRTGMSKLDGSTVIGRVYESEAQGFLVELITEEELFDAHRSWAAIARRRLADGFFPTLAPYRLSVRVVLTVLSHASWAHIESQPREATGYLGYDRLRGKPDTQHRVVLFSGVAGETATD